jgi:hypothetical protein
MLTRACLSQGETRHWYNKYAAHEVEDGVPNVWQYAGATDRTLFATNTVPQSESPSRGLHRPHSVAEFSRSTTSFSSTYSPHADPDFAAGRRPGLTIRFGCVFWSQSCGVLGRRKPLCLHGWFLVQSKPSLAGYGRSFE